MDIQIDENIIDIIKNKKNIIKKNQEEDIEYIIGIDLGTTNSCCSVFKDNEIIIITDERNNKYIPSYVGYTNTNKYVGNDAKNQSIINSNNVYYEVKRLIGLKYSNDMVQKEKQFLSYKYISDDNDNIRLLSTLGYTETKTFSPEEISAQVLLKMKQMASEFLKTKINKAVITIPARFTDAQRQATYDAASIAGLEVVRMINEPTAAAIAYGMANKKINKDESVNVIVYDFGGGTLDVSIVEITVDDNGENIFTVLGSAGNTHLGGADFDNKLLGFTINKFKQKYKLESLSNIESLSIQKLKQQCENAKKILSTKTKTQIYIEKFYEDKDLLFTLTRSDLEVICGDLLLICLKPIDDVLESTNLMIDDINEIILVGGMTRMPSIINRIEMKFKKKPCLSLNPDEAIAIGAGYQGAYLSGNVNPFTENMILIDIIPLSMGVETVGGIMDIIVEINTPIPYSITRTYTTDSDYETSVLIKIFEGERTLTVDNIFVGEFELTGIESAPRGIAKIDVTFSIDLNGIVTVTAIDTKSNEKSSIIVNSNKGRLSKQEILKLIEEAKELEIRDEIERRKKMMHYECDDICTNIINNLKSPHFKLSESNKESIKNDITLVLEWLKQKKYYDRSDEELEHTLENLKKRYGTLIVRGVLEKDVNVSGLENNEGTNIYTNENDENDENNIENDYKIMDLIENENVDKLTEEEKEELKNLRKELFDLCYSIFDIINNNGFTIEKNHKNELKDFIDDALLWAHVHEKPTKIDYKQKIDEINDACDKILKEYEDKKIFAENELNNCKPKAELENLAIILKMLIEENKTMIKENNKKKLETYLENIFNILYNDEEQSDKSDKSDKSDEFYKNKIDELNNICSEIYKEINNINLSVNVLNMSNKILNNNDSNDCNGTNIETLLKIRQEEEIQKIMDNDD